MPPKRHLVYSQAAAPATPHAQQNNHDSTLWNTRVHSTRNPETPDARSPLWLSPEGASKIPIKYADRRTYSGHPRLKELDE